MTKILVTGSNGQLGNELKLRTKFLPDFEFEFIDIEDLDLTNLEDTETFILKYQPNYIINCAAYTAVDKAEKEVESAFMVNTHGAEHLASASKRSGSRLIHVSTDYVYSGDGNTPIKEDAATKPKSIYGKSKLKGEKKVLKACESIIIRTSWLYSGFGNNFVKTILRLAKERDELGVIFDQTGTPTFAGDLAEAILQIIKISEEKGNFEKGIYNFSNEGVCSWYDFAKTIVDYAKLDCIIKAIETADYPLPAPRPQFSVMNKAKIRGTFGIEIPFWMDSLKKVIAQLQ